MDLIAYNRQAHDEFAADYDAAHVEIFNPTEQKRIENALKYAISQITGESGIPLVLDFGAGTGNLTRQLLNLQINVVAADVSPGCLEYLKKKVSNPDRLQTLLLTGETLADIKDDTFDMVATYSVLHHIPDYLKVLEELVRVLKPGSVIYIDHEVCPSYWEEDDLYFAYLKELGGRFLHDHLYEMGLPREKPKRKMALIGMPHYLIRKIFPKKSETRKVSCHGDIHVFKDDHIEWGDIESRLTHCCEILVRQDYLVCREESDQPPVWKKWNDKCADMRLIIARKRVEA